MIAAPKIAALGISESIAAPEIVDPTFHYHKCPVCSHIWGHFLLPTLTDAQSQKYAEAHICPHCKMGKDIWRRHIDGSYVDSHVRGILIVAVLEPFL